MKRYIKSSESIYASSFNRAISHMNREQCGFITAFREYDSEGNPLSINEKRRRNKQLEADIRASGLTFIKASGGFVENKGTDLETRVSEDTFCVINNRFPTEKFIALMVYWCRKYEQDSVLITTPVPERSKNGQPLTDKPINIIGEYYTKNGTVDMRFDNATVQDAEEYFTNIHGKDFVLSSTEMVDTKWHDIHSAAGRVHGYRDFADLYPDL